MTEEEIAETAARHARAKAWACERWPWVEAVNYVKGRSGAAVYEARGFVLKQARRFRVEGSSFVEEP